MAIWSSGMTKAELIQHHAKYPSNRHLPYQVTEAARVAEVTMGARPGTPPLIRLFRCLGHFPYQATDATRVAEVTLALLTQQGCYDIIK